MRQRVRAHRMPERRSSQDRREDPITGWEMTVVC